MKRREFLGRSGLTLAVGAVPVALNATAPALAVAPVVWMLDASLVGHENALAGLLHGAQPVWVDRNPMNSWFEQIAPALHSGSSVIGITRPTARFIAEQFAGFDGRLVHCEAIDLSGSAACGPAATLDRLCRLTSSPDVGRRARVGGHPGLHMTARGFESWVLAPRPIQTLSIGI